MRASPPPRSLFGWSGAAALAVAVITGDARADEATNRFSPAFSSWGGEIAVGAVSIGTGITGFLLPQTRRGLAPDQARPDDDGLEAASWVTAIAPAGFHLATYFLEWRLRASDDQDAHAWAFMPMLVEAEAVSLAMGTTQIVSRAVGRCRPRAWDDVHETCPSGDDDSFASLPSIGTTIPSALAGSRLVFALRSKGSALTAMRWINYGATEVLALASGGLNVGAGAGSITDVLAGWAIGHAAGIGVALMHPMGPAPLGRVAIGPGSVSWSGAF